MREGGARDLEQRRVLVGPRRFGVRYARDQRNSSDQAAGAESLDREVAPVADPADEAQAPALHREDRVAARSDHVLAMHEAPRRDPPGPGPRRDAVGVVRAEIAELRTFVDEAGELLAGVVNHVPRPLHVTRLRADEADAGEDRVVAVRLALPPAFRLELERRAAELERDPADRLEREGRSRRQADAADLQVARARVERARPVADPEPERESARTRGVARASTTATAASVWRAVSDAPAGCALVIGPPSAPGRPGPRRPPRSACPRAGRGRARAPPPAGARARAESPSGTPGGHARQAAEETALIESAASVRARRAAPRRRADRVRRSRSRSTRAPSASPRARRPDRGRACTPGAARRTHGRGRGRGRLAAKRGPRRRDARARSSDSRVACAFAVRAIAPRRAHQTATMPSRIA